MENGAIDDEQISASSQWDGNHAARQGRLQFKQNAGKQGAWSSRTNDQNQWLQISMGDHHKVTGVGTQGRDRVKQWVTKYQLLFSNDGVNFQAYKGQGAATKVKLASFTISLQSDSNHRELRPKRGHNPLLDRKNT